MTQKNKRKYLQILEIQNDKTNQLQRTNESKTI